MVIECALEWLRGPLSDIQGVLAIVSSFIFQFQGVQLRELERSPTHPFYCFAELSDGWAIGDGFGSVSVYDINATRLLYEVKHPYAVYSIAPLSDNAFVSNAEVGFWVARTSLERRITFQTTNYQDHGHCILKLVSFPNGFVVSASKAGLLHVWDTKLDGADCYVRSLPSSEAVADVTKCGEHLASLHKHFASTTVETSACIWDMQTGTLLKKIALDFRYFKSFTPLDDKTLVFSTFDGFHVYDVESGAKLFHKRLESTAWTSYDSVILCATPDVDLYATTDNDTLTTLDMQNRAKTFLPSPTVQASLLGLNGMFYISSGHIIAHDEHRRMFVWK
jgi:WD40 repeat protein